MTDTRFIQEQLQDLQKNILQQRDHNRAQGIPFEDLRETLPWGLAAQKGFLAYKSSYAAFDESQARWTYLRMQENKPLSAFMLASNDAGEVRAFNSHIQGLREGEIGKRPYWKMERDKIHTQDRVIFHETREDLKFKENDRGTVISIKGVNRFTEVRLDSGDHVHFSLGHNVKFGLGYATTLDRLESLKAEHIIIKLSGAGVWQDLEKVLASQHTESIGWVITDHATLDMAPVLDLFPGRGSPGILEYDFDLANKVQNRELFVSETHAQAITATLDAWQETAQHELAGSVMFATNTRDRSELIRGAQDRIGEQLGMVSTQHGADRIYEQDYIVFQEETPFAARGDVAKVKGIVEAERTFLVELSSGRLESFSLDDYSAFHPAYAQTEDMGRNVAFGYVFANNSLLRNYYDLPKEEFSERPNRLCLADEEAPVFLHRETSVPEFQRTIREHDALRLEQGREASKTRPDLHLVSSQDTATKRDREEEERTKPHLQLLTSQDNDRGPER